MKKGLFFTTVLLIVISILASGYIYHKGVTENRAQKNALACTPVSGINVYPASFSLSPIPFVPMVRKNVYSLSAAEIASLKAGISAMKALPLSNPTSWQYQAAIHGTTLTNNLPSWKSCQHGTQFFLSWHRMYLYFFERILRAKSGNPNLTLPYWNYQTNPVLHPDYRNSASGNPLYDGTRNSSINSGGSLGPGPMTAINNALNDIPFFDFNSDLEGPHGSIHVAIGGNMGSVPTAAKDPCFWLHHANIDRLWEEWLRKCGGRSNPTPNAAWMNQNFTFFDENGNAVSMTGSQIVNTATQLNYRYDFPPMLPCNFKLDWWKWKWIRWPLLRFPEVIRIRERETRFAFKNTQLDSLEFFVRKEGDRFEFSRDNISDKLFLEFNEVKVNKLPQGVIEVYINLSPNESPAPKSRSFAGVLDLFTATAPAHHNERKNALRINISAAAQALELRASDLRKAELTFVVKGNTLRLKEMPATADIQLANMHVAIEKAQK